MSTGPRASLLSAMADVANRDLRSPKAWGEAAHEITLLAALNWLSGSGWLPLSIIFAALALRVLAEVAGHVFLGAEPDDR